MSLLTYPKFSAQDVSGVNLSGGKVYFYIAGTSTLKDTYSDPEFTVANTNPVILNSRGEADIYINGSYKIVLNDADDVEVWTQDNFTSQTSSQWENSVPSVFLTNRSFKVTGDLRTSYEEGRRIKINDASTLYGTISTSTYFAPDTTVTVVLISGNISASLVATQLSILTVSDDSIPQTYRQIYKASASGTVDIINAASTPKLPELTDGVIIFLVALGANTSTTPTVNVDFRGAKTITKGGNQPLAIGDINGADHELILKYNSGNNVFELLNPKTLLVPNWTFPTQIGTPLNIAVIGTVSIEAINNVDIAFLDSANDQLRTYRFDGANWAQLGAGLAVGNTGAADLTALNSTDIAFLDEALEELRTYRWSGSAWSFVGSGLSIAGIGNPGLAALNSTDIAFAEGNFDELRTYRFSGTTWAQVGNGLDLTAIAAPSMSALNSTDIAFTDFFNAELRTYRFDGTDWAQVGNSLAITSAGTVNLVAINSTDVAYIDATND